MNLILLPFGILLNSCGERKAAGQNEDKLTCFVQVLGTLQDGGSPQAGCTKKCCSKFYTHPDPARKVVSLAFVDLTNQKRYLIEAGPDFTEQLFALNRLCNFSVQNPWPDGIFISHAHVGHYIGLFNLGKECLNAKNASVYTMPRMKHFLEHNGPWDQLCKNQNIFLRNLKVDSAITLSPEISVTPLLVPHRDEYSETVGFILRGPQKSLLFVPDIDKWEKWEQSLIEVLKTVDYALLDGTFYNAGEVPGRDMSEIPHPFVIETIHLLKDLPPDEKKKIYFIHLNHSNPLLDTTSEALRIVSEAGFSVSFYGQKYDL